MNILDQVHVNYKEGRRILAPLLGFPAVKPAGTSVKLAQQNAGEHMKVMQRIAEKWHPDVVFTLMDLSVEASALGRETLFPPDEAATVVNFEYDKEQDLPLLQGINILEDGRLQSYVETHKRMKRDFPADIIRGAYVTGPYTLAGLIMGAESAAMETMMDPEGFHALCAVCTDKILDYTQAMIEAGAHVIAVLEPSAMMLGPEQFREFSMDYTRKIIDVCHQHDVGMVYHICGNTEHLLESLNDSGADALSLDSDVNFPQAAKIIREDMILIGNVCPTGTIMTGHPESVQKEVQKLLEDMKDVPNYILSTGCDLPLEVPEENVTAFMQTGRK
ncbi:MAG: Uroporphyrinogen decarboxylase (URO-D) [Marinimicrobia bacterium 46_47]|nr:MAG: Uroporphyrinogen decarboxylase (URO-D) [Marinimicrobia bacterium 46_47]KUK92985.1 MAG: Uroporphyrinogen decarboxylase (URO-D) [Marinimicrobia bacterium 46_43]